MSCWATEALDLHARLALGGEKLRSGRTMVICCAAERGRRCCDRRTWTWRCWPALCWVGAGRVWTWRCGWLPGSAAGRPARRELGHELGDATRSFSFGEGGGAGGGSVFDPWFLALAPPGEALDMGR